MGAKVRRGVYRGGCVCGSSYERVSKGGNGGLL